MSFPESSIPQRRWRRIIPVAFVMYTIAYIDRTNISLALPSLSSDLRIGPAEAGAATGVFFWGYLLLQIPGGYLAERWSAKKLVSVLLVVWGACAAATALVSTGMEFWVMRLLLGGAEGGVFPATIILLANWFPPAERARANAYWMLCQPLAIVISSPLSGWILGHWNWRVLLFAEGALPFLWLPVWSLAMDDHPSAANGLPAEEREYLAKVHEAPPRAPEQSSAGSLTRAFTKAQVWILVALYFFLNCGGYGYLFWLPSALVSVKKLPSFLLGVLFAVPYLLTGVTMVLNSRHSDREQERRLHVAIPLLLGGCLLFLSVLTATRIPLLSFTLVCLAGASFYSCLGPLWAIPTESVSREVAGPATGLVNAIGNLGGYFGPLLVGVCNRRSGDFEAAFAVLSASLILAGILAFFLKPAATRALPTLEA